VAANPIKIPDSKVARTMATRSISVSLDEELLAALDAQGGNRSASVTEAIQLWLRRRELERLQEAYGQLALIQGGDLDHAMADGAAMGTAVLQGLDG
jgi:metal-responsive CopG/Arc/MetJ family transcriptional regulator